jgi:hypothetical protein
MRAVDTAVQNLSCSEVVQLLKARAEVRKSVLSALAWLDRADGRPAE